jgi:hypothetical protein
MTEGSSAVCALCFGTTQLQAVAPWALAQGDRPTYCFLLLCFVGVFASFRRGAFCFFKRPSFANPNPTSRRVVVLYAHLLPKSTIPNALHDLEDML